MKGFKNKETKRKRNKLIISLFLCLITFISIFKNLDSTKIEYDNQKLVKQLLNNTTNNKNSYLKKLTKKMIEDIYNSPTKYLLQTQSNLIKKAPVIIPVLNKTEEYKPTIYIYNTHQTEEYTPSDFIEYSIKPQVTMANYIMEEQFNKNNYQTYIETASIKEILNNNNWKYGYSYKASRILLEQRKKEHPSLTYFIDVHRDSLKKDKTTIIINEKTYAKLLFIVGLENVNYQENLIFTEQINNCLNSNYPNLSKGIYKKSGPGVNGVYNQDFSSYTILVEVGGYENTTNEVLNSSIAFSNCFMEVIKTHEPKTNS